MARFGQVKGDQMAFSFPELVAHAARTRDLVAGTVIGSGTVSNAEYATVVRPAFPNAARSRSSPTESPPRPSCILATMSAWRPQPAMAAPRLAR
jgi:2-keto-4-pentenoate hydratase/2-oxohepta-3-ene-1,7-dioic acid hydratase in catechol pathway